MTPTFLTLADVLEIHRDQIARYGGKRGVRDMALLESAVAAPCASFGGRYLHADVFDTASAYLFHIIRNHPFADGNKRTGLLCAVVFLGMNGVRADLDDESIESIVLMVAEGKTTESEVADFFRSHCGRS